MDIQLKNHVIKIDPGANKHYWTHINSIDWEPHTFAIFDYFVKEKSVVLDIGSWSGVLTLYAAKTAQKVHALDPDPVCFKELEINIALNPEIAKNIQTHNIAISNKAENIKLSARKAYGQSSSSILTRKRDLENSLEIKTISLLDFLTQKNIKQVDFIKMDIEGAEFKILPTLKPALQNINFPTLYISFHYNYLKEHIYNAIIPSSFFNKVLLKLEHLFGFTLFKKRIRKEICNLYDGLKSYKYIYKTDGNLVTFQDLNKNPELIKIHDLVFTNIEWKN